MPQRHKNLSISTLISKDFFLPNKMPLKAEMLDELKPSIHRIIKQLLGFSEERLLTESLSSIQHGVDKFELTRKLSSTHYCAST